MINELYFELKPFVQEKPITSSAVKKLEVVYLIGHDKEMKREKWLLSSIETS